jgi:hypothetical protein
MDRLEAQIAGMSQLMQNMASWSSGRKCYRCGKEGRIAWDCPKPPPGVSLPCASSGGPRWLLDSDCFHDMHPGGTGIFKRYRKFEQPMPVQLAKRGVTATAVGVGELVLAGCLGPVVLSEVLHVPDLESPLFSVKVALHPGLSVHFSPPAQPCGMDKVVIMQHGQMLFTATSRGAEELYFLEQGYFAAAGAVCVQQLAHA